VAGNAFSATGGAGNDVLTIDFTAGASLPNGMSLNGGGADTLVYSDLNGLRGHVYVLTKTAINRDGGKSNVAYSNIEGVSVLGSLTNDLFIVQGTPDGSTTSLRGLGGANAIYVSSDAPTSRGDLSGIGGPLLIDPGTGPSNLLVVSEYGRTGPDDVTFTASTMTFTAGKRLDINYAPSGLGYQRGNVKLVVGGGNDIVRTQGTAAQAITSLYTIGGNATILVTTAGGAQNTLQGTLDIDAGTGAAQLIFSEANALVADNLTLSANRLVSNTSGFVMNYTATGGAFSRGFLLNTGAANDVVTVNGTAPGSYTSINTGPGPDLVTVNVSGPDADVLVIDGGDNGAPAGNLLFVNDVVGGATAFSSGPGSGLVRLSYPGGLRDVYYFSMDQVFSNPAAS
jgi:hypothetical protein